MPSFWKPRLGAVYLGDGRCRFRVWASRCERVDLHVTAPVDRVVPMRPVGTGYFEVVLDGVEPGTRYLYRLDGGAERPDPASRLQPTTVHEPSAVVDPAFPWTDAHWHGVPLDKYVIYELHVGTFTPEGTFDAVVPYLDELVGLGATAVELMPVAQFAGRRGWGYDGVYPFAPQNSYGGPAGLKRLVDACHARGLAVVLDVVYNHFGPEGGYLHEFAHYFTDRYKTPWGNAVNVDGPKSDEVRRYLIENALYWVHEFHVDALRLDAVHAIYDVTAAPFLMELGNVVGRYATDLNRQVYLIAESDLNDPRVLRSPDLGGLGLHAQWADDLHHCVFTLLAGEECPYHRDYDQFGLLVNAYQHGYAYTGQFSATRERRHGNQPANLAGRQFVVCIQNHDQIGNRKFGERFGALVSFEAQKLAAAAVMLAPYTPMLFMGEEYGEPAPFQYFVDFSDPDLVEAVRRGRREEFQMTGGDPPDPQAADTFRRSVLNRGLRHADTHKVLWDFYREVLRLRRESPALRFPDRERMRVTAFQEHHTLAVERWDGDAETLLVINLSDRPAEVRLTLRTGTWQRDLDSAAAEWNGPGSVAPPELVARSEVQLTVAATSVVAYTLLIDPVTHR
ncbi:malto-oligosyltrehalose trehalohydrolase [Gemmata sp.]|uniref:malto-oligosyltrehalose trehalohydrolase n=1 Tax=Gemmata sp. TaxID=1914242 RepID=UPI003F7241A9